MVEKNSPDSLRISEEKVREASLLNKRGQDSFANGAYERERAIDFFKQAICINPDFAEAHCNLGNSMANQGKLQQAVASFTEALRINPGDSRIRRDLEQLQQRLAKSGKSSSKMLQ